MEDYTDNQMKYIHSVDGQAHIDAVEIIGQLDKEIKRLRELVKDGFYEGFDYGTGAGEPRWEQSKVCRALAEVGRD